MDQAARCECIVSINYDHAGGSLVPNTSALLAGTRLSLLRPLLFLILKQYLRPTL